MLEENKAFFIECAKKIDVEIDDEILSRFSAFEDLFLEWNSKLNLTRITDEKEIVIKHFVDSLTVLKYLEGANLRIADIGTGAGFPGLPIKFVREDFDMFLVDSLNKRLKFIDVVIDELRLKNVRTLHFRAEDLGRDKLHRGKFDVVVSRAVASLKVLLEFSIPLLKKDGIFIAMKGQSYEEELAISEKFMGEIGCELVEKEEFVLPCSDYSRTILVFKKIKPTSEEYPRSFAKIKNA